MKQTVRKTGKLETTDTDKFVRETYVFSTAGNRDPFIVINPVGTGRTVTVEQSPDAAASGEVTYRLGGLIWNERRPGSTGYQPGSAGQSVALIYTSDNKKWIAVNDKFVYPDDLPGYEVRIHADRVMLTTPDGKTVELRLRRI